MSNAYNNVMRKQKNLSVISLVLMTVIWGGTFPMIKTLLATTNPLELLAFRFLFASLVGLPFLMIETKKYKSSLLKLILIGVTLWVAYYTQTVGLKYTSPSKSAFITGL